MESYSTFALPAYIAVTLVLASVQTFTLPLPQFLLGVQELLAHGRIHSVFLPIGYPLLLAPAFAVAPWWGDKGVHALTELLNVVLCVGIFLCLLQWLARFIGVRLAGWAAFAIALFPELMRTLASVSDTALTCLLVVGSLVALTRLAESPAVTRAAGFGAVVGLGIAVRPNLLLFLLAGLMPLWPVNWSRRVVLIGVYVGVAIAIYAGVTTAGHGRPFVPQNGPYNLFAGMNENAGWSLRSDFANGELSIVPALRNRGLNPRWDWTQQSDRPGVDDSRDLKYAPLYRKAAVEYAREHPGEALKLTAYKFYNLFRPMRMKGVAMKRDKWLLAIALSRLMPLLWVAAVVWDCKQGGRGPWTLVSALVALYIVPFLITNSDPRFGTPIELLLSADAARILLQRREPVQGEPYLTSVPRPAA